MIRNLNTSAFRGLITLGSQTKKVSMSFGKQRYISHPKSSLSSFAQYPDTRGSGPTFARSTQHISQPPNRDLHSAQHPHPRALPRRRRPRRPRRVLLDPKAGPLRMDRNTAVSSPVHLRRRRRAPGYPSARRTRYQRRAPATQCQSYRDV